MIASKAKIFDTIVIHREFWGGILWNLKTTCMATLGEKSIEYLVIVLFGKFYIEYLFINTVERTIYNEKF